MVDQQVRDTFHARSGLVTPLAITVFVWVFCMNALDLIPVDFIPKVMSTLFHVEHWKAVPTTDPNADTGSVARAFRNASTIEGATASPQGVVCLMMAHAGRLAQAATVATAASRSSRLLNDSSLP